MKLNLLLVLSILVMGCATKGPNVVQTYTTPLIRNEIAVLKLEQRSTFKIVACDDKLVYSNSKYILLKPGRHEIWFDVWGQTLVASYSMRNKKYLDAKAGHTYVLRSKGIGIFVEGDKWFPEVVDLTDSKQHVSYLPTEDLK